jgi:16S rRNA (cytosine967-C5)-methyltransferase
VQDLAAQLAGWLLAPEPGEAVADLCAAPGGKTGHLWELMGGRGRLMAWERDPVRRRVLMQNVERLHGAEHGIDLPQGEGEGPLGDAAAAGSFDAVLLDAPCQALGLIRRHPEARWDDRLQERGAVLTTQRGLLTAGARLVRPGGRLLWVTCSPTRAENEDQVALFLAGHPEWDTERGVVPTGLDTLVQWTGDTLRTRPDAAPWDGFAYTLLRRMP